MAVKMEMGAMLGMEKKAGLGGNLATDVDN